MLFSSPLFVFGFLPAVLLLYFCLSWSRPAQNILLFAASVLFYACGEPLFVLVLLASIAVNWLFGLTAERLRGGGRREKLNLAAMLTVNLSLLFVCKYLVFFTEQLNSFAGLGLPVPEITLPIGISFFTFQSISYVVDISRGHGNAQKNILNVGLYISFFPQLIAGPIVRYETVAAQLTERRVTLEKFSRGVCRFISGLAKKVLISNQMAIIADKMFGADELSVLAAWLGALAYTFQIYFDFSGYSDMAIGLGAMFGFEFDENFNYPYVSRSVTEFWRRWHISLGTWFRDYVYIPLGGSRVKSRARLIFNLFVVWLLTGLWHGASWSFVVWGLWFFVFLTVEKLCIPNYLREGGRLPARIIGHLYTMLAVIFGWVVFRAETLGEALSYAGKMLGIGASALCDTLFLQYAGEKWAFLLAAALFSLPIARLPDRLAKSECPAGRLALGLLYPAAYISIFLVSVAFLLKEQYNPFIYFNF